MLESELEGKDQQWKSEYQTFNIQNRLNTTIISSLVFEWSTLLCDLSYEGCKPVLFEVLQDAIAFSGL